MSLKSISLILNALLICAIIYLVREQGDSEGIIRSEERVKALESQLTLIEVERDSLKLIGDSIKYELSLKPKERILIKYKYNEELKDIVSLDVDESISFLTERLSKEDGSWE